MHNCLPVNLLFCGPAGGRLGEWVTEAAGWAVSGGLGEGGRGGEIKVILVFWYSW